MELYLEKAKLLFKLDSAGKKEDFSLILNQKENNINNIFYQLYSRISRIQKEYNNLEEKICTDNEFIIMKNNIEKELNNKTKETEDIKKEYINAQKNCSKINEINRIKKDNFRILCELNENNKRNEDKKKNLEKKIGSMKEHLNLMKNNLDENGKILDEINDNMDKCQNHLNILDNEISEVKEKKNDINQSISENMEIDDILKEIENLQKENSEIQNKLEENNKKLNFLNKALEEVENYEKKGKKRKKIKNNKKMNKTPKETDLKTQNKEIDIKENPK